jgi:hypothetical protein
MQHGQDNVVASICVLVGTAAVCALGALATRAANKHRNREEALARLQGYSEAEFRRRYRISRERFNNLAEIIRPQVEPTTPVAIARAIASSGSVVKAELRVGAALRVLSGGSYLDAADLHAIHDKSFNQTTLWPVCRAITSTSHPDLDNVHFPFDDEMQLRRHEATFKKQAGHLFPGTVAVGDGCGLRIEQPSDEEVGGNVKDHHTRKYDYAYGFLLFCDGHNHIMSVEATHVASAHDAAMYESSFVHKAIEDGKLPHWAHVLLDSAFACTEQELVPWPVTKNALGEDKDAFNFKLSQQRQAVERTFGLLYARWGILWRPLRVKFDNLGLLLHTLCRLHNYCMQDRHVAILSHIDDLAHEEDLQWKRGAPTGHMRLILAQAQTLEQRQRQGKRTDLESSRRVEITNVIRRHGFKRPLIGEDAIFVGMMRDDFLYLSLGGV